MRVGTAGRRGDLWNDRTVAWYERANAGSDYAERVLAAAADLVDECRTALDVGAGFGALALPLARRMTRVTALEPAPAMAAALRRAVQRAGLANVHVLEAPWEDAEVEPHDLVLCAHVSHLLRRGSSFLPGASGLARRGVVLVRDAPGAGDKLFFGELYPLLLGRPYDHGCAREDTVEELDRLGIQARVTPIDYASDQPFESLDEACDFWMEYMRLEGDEARRFLRGFLDGRLARRGGKLIAPFKKRTVVIQWRVGRS